MLTAMFAGGTMRLRSGMSAILVLLFAATSALAQDNARFAGSVIDGTGAFVAGATVTVKNQRTGEERTATTGEGGAFIIPNLKPSTYTIRASKDGFAPIE